MTTYRVFYTVRTLQLGYVDVQADSEDAAKDQAADVTAKGKDGALTLMPATFDSEFAISKNAWTSTVAGWQLLVAGWEPSSRFVLYLVNDEIDPRLASYGGVVWPTAWTQLFQTARKGTYGAAVEITDLGLMYRAAALYGASDMYADTRLL